jgi:acyl-CoA thioesterase-1
VVAALVAGGIVVGQVGASADLGARCADTRALSAARAELVTGSGPRVAVIGDSYAMGTGLADPAGSWPAYLSGEVHVDGFAGSGFTPAASPCRGVAYAVRAGEALALRPELVVVEGGLNDYDVPTADIETSARRLLSALDGVAVVLVGPADAPSRSGQVPRVDAALARVAAGQGVPYVSPRSWELTYLEDGLHLTPEGHEVFGHNVAAALEAVA